MTTDIQKKLQKAVIYEVDKKGVEVKGGIRVPCMFNPSEYTVSKSNSYKVTESTKGNAPRAEFASVGSQILRLSLTFDTYETGEDVSEKTRVLWKFMQPKEDNVNKKVPKGKPVQVAFEWGVFQFVAFITSISQQFTLFTHQGVPVRAKVNVDFTQYIDTEDYKQLKTNPTSGGGPTERLWKVVSGDRLDNIAQEVYSDPAKWRLIADQNRLFNPLALRPGMVLRIPND